jgi:hypothetical protein
MGRVEGVDEGRHEEAGGVAVAMKQKKCARAREKKRQQSF